jgi:hypothetical protein
MEERWPAQRVLLVGESDRLEPEAARRTLAGCGGAVAEVTVIGIVARRTFVSRWAPLSGLVTLEQLEQLDRQEAEATCDVTRRATAALPSAIPARYHCVRRWQDVRSTFHEHDLVLVVMPPRRWLDRRRLASWERSRAAAVRRRDDAGQAGVRWRTWPAAARLLPRSASLWVGRRLRRVP